MDAVDPSDDPHAPVRMISAFQCSNQLAPNGWQHVLPMLRNGTMSFIRNKTNSGSIQSWSENIPDAYWLPPWEEGVTLLDWFEDMTWNDGVSLKHDNQIKNWTLLYSRCARPEARWKIWAHKCKTFKSRWPAQKQRCGLNHSTANIHAGWPTEPPDSMLHPI